MNRKGMALVKVAVGILVLALLLVLLFFLFKAGIKAASLAEDSECQSSIRAHAILLKTVESDLVPEITCPTKYYTITSSDKDKIQYYLAESMKSCWGTWGRGELELFKQEGTYCHICSVTDFKRKGNEVAGFNDYLYNEKLKDGPFEGMTYLEYLGSAYQGDVGEVANTEAGRKTSDNVIYTDSSYATIFVYAKGEEDLKRFYESFNPTFLGGRNGVVIGGGVFGALVGGVVGVALCFTGVGCLAVAGAVAGGVAGGFLGSSVSEDVGWVAVTLLKPYNAEELKAIGCEISPAKQDRQKENLG